MGALPAASARRTCAAPSSRQSVVLHAGPARPPASGRRLEPRPDAPAPSSGQQTVDTRVVQSLERAVAQPDAPPSPEPGDNMDAWTSMPDRLPAAAKAAPALPASTLLNTLLFVVAAIVYERGVQDILDRLLGDGPAGSLTCIVVGIGLVVFARLQVTTWSPVFSLDETD